MYSQLSTSDNNNLLYWQVNVENDPYMTVEAQPKLDAWYSERSLWTGVNLSHLEDYNFKVTTYKINIWISLNLSSGVNYWNQKHNSVTMTSHLKLKPLCEMNQIENPCCQ